MTVPAKDKNLEAARAAKKRAKAIFEPFGSVVGVGITEQAGSYAVKVNLGNLLSDAGKLPDKIGTVPVVVHVTGRVHKQS